MSKNKKIFGLIGYPLGHTLSPNMHNAGFKALGIDVDCEYTTFSKSPDELKSFLLSEEGKNVSGFNVTVPYKEKILELITNLKQHETVEAIGAANTIIKTETGYKAYNTDVCGFAQDLNLKGFNKEGKKAAILGAGGAARAVAYALSCFADTPVREITIYDIDNAKAESIAKMIKNVKNEFNIKVVDSIADLEIKKSDILINATPIGLKKSDPLIVDENLLHKDLFVYDLIYNPAETKLLKAAKKAQASCSNGLGMLLYQGEAAFAKFAGVCPVPENVVESMKTALKEGLKNV